MTVVARLVSFQTARRSRRMGVGISASMPMSLTLVEAVAGRPRAEAVAGDLGLLVTLAVSALLMAFQTGARAYIGIIAAAGLLDAADQESRHTPMNSLFTISAILLQMLSPDGPAVHAPGPFARIVVLKPKPAQRAAFTEGYKRHLAWHRNNKDPWTWHGWTFVLGERVGQFMDGTFGHALDDFDHAVNPAGDSADNDVNVTPYADFVSHGIYERIEAASVGNPLPADSPYLALTTYIVVPGQEKAFESAIQELARHQTGRHMSWYRLRIGGQRPQYLLMRSVRTFSGGGSLPEIELPGGVVHRVQSELLRYQPGLSYVPDGESH